MTTKSTVDVGKLTNFAARALQKVGLPQEDAMTTARILVKTDLRGIDTHGVNRLAAPYIKGIQEGAIKG